MRRRADEWKEGTGCRCFSEDDIKLRFLCMRGLSNVEVVPRDVVSSGLRMETIRVYTASVAVSVRPQPLSSRRWADCLRRCDTEGVRSIVLQVRRPDTRSHAARRIVDICGER